MARMTEEEAAYWDDYYTKNPPKVDPAKKGGYFTCQRELLNVLDRVLPIILSTVPWQPIKCQLKLLAKWYEKKSLQLSSVACI
jgi:hypothetical protein